MPKRVVGLAVFSVVLVLAVSSLALSAPPEPKRGGTLVIGQAAAPKSLTTIIDPGKPGITILNQTEEGLLGYNEKGQIVPVLAEAMPETPDKLTFIFKVRQGIRFHDGDEVTAEHARYAFERMIDPKYRATFGAVYRQNVAKLEVPDKFTLKITMKQPWPQFPAFAAGNHPKLINPKIAEHPDFGTKVWSGTGPFKVQEWVQGDRVVLVRNESYWQKGLPYLDRIVYRTIPEDSTRVANLLTGQVMVDQDPDFKAVPRFQSDPRFTVLAGISNNTLLMAFNLCNPPFNTRALRRAVSMGIDRSEIIKVVFGGLADVAGDVFPPNHWAHDKNIVEKYDPDGAKRLLREAGYDASKPFEFTLVPIDQAVFMDSATLVQAHLAKVGVRVNIRPMEYTAQSATMRKPKSEWPAPAFMFRITPLRSTAFEFSTYQYGSGGALNFSGYNRPGCYQNAEVEKLIDQANTYSDFVRGERELARPLWKAISRAILEDAPQLRLVFWRNIDIVAKTVRDYPLMEGDVNVLMRTWIDK